MGTPLKIAGPVLLLMGPLGLFFSRFGQHLEGKGIAVYKLSLPLHEFGFRREQRLPFDGPPEAFPAILAKWIEQYKIRHVFMYGDYISLHRIALMELRRYPCVSTGVFELGYARPNHITLESTGVNARSSLSRDPGFYWTLPTQEPPHPDLPPLHPPHRSMHLRLVKAGTFIVHAFQRYPLLPYRHKLQPRPYDIWAQYLGFLRSLLYPLSEAPVRRRLRDSVPYVMVALQVASDSQIQEFSSYADMEVLINEITASFATHATHNLRLVFKHHPRDRGYNHYGHLISRLRNRFRLERHRLLYLHDAPLAPLLANPHCRGLITVNSTVGLQAIQYGVPVKLMGDAFFAIDGLVDRGPISRFWRAPQRPNIKLWERFQKEMMERTQYWGNFDGEIDFNALVSIRSGNLSSPVKPS